MCIERFRHDEDAVPPGLPAPMLMRSPSLSIRTLVLGAIVEGQSPVAWKVPPEAGGGALYLHDCRAILARTTDATPRSAL